MKCDLDITTIERMISEGCLYCGETDILKISVDRIDNNIGHIGSNVNPACLRCNLVRGDMPYNAWMEVANGMRNAREKGLFGDWDGPLLNRSRADDGGTGGILTHETL